MAMMVLVVIAVFLVMALLVVTAVLMPERWGCGGRQRAIGAGWYFGL